MKGSYSFAHLQVLASSDETGLINVWALGQKPGDGILHKNKIDSYLNDPVTAMALWNKFAQGIKKVASLSYRSAFCACPQA